MQRAEIEKYCAAAAPPLKIDKWYLDDGVSGTIRLARRVPSSGKPGGKALMEDAQAGLIGEIVVLKFDRLGRKVLDILNTYEKLERLGVAVRSFTQPLPEGANGQMMLQMWAVFAEWDRANLLANMSAGMKAKAKTGGWTGGRPPFGYRVDRVVDVKGSERLALHEVNAPIVRRLFEDAAAGKSGPVLAAYLNEQGVPTSWQNPGSVWRSSSVRVIVTNPIYMGTREWGRRQWYEGPEDENGDKAKHLRHTPGRVEKSACPVVVSKELWEAANVAMKKNQILAMAKPKNPYLLQGLVTCGICGSKYGGRGRYYCCLKRSCARRLNGKTADGKTKNPCPAPLVRRAEIEAGVWDLLEAYISNPGEAGEALRLEMEKQVEPTRKVADDIRRAEDDLAKNGVAREKARVQWQEGWATKEESEKDVRRLMEKRAAIEARLSDLRRKSADRQTKARDRSAAVSVLERLRQSVRGEYTFDQKRQMVEVWVAGVTIPPDAPHEYRIDFRFPCRAPGWLRGPAPAAQVKAGVMGLRVALGAIPERCGSTN